MRPEEEYLRDIIEAATSVDSFVAGIDFDIFAGTRIIRSAVLHELLTIGEACAHLPPDLHESHPDIPWRGIIGLRNVIAHGYFGMNWELVWTTATIRLPTLRRQISDILESEYS